MSSPWELGLLIKELVRLNRHLGTAMAEDLGIHWSDFQALDDLSSEGPMGPAELGRRLGLGSAAATALADRLEAAGHVRRERHPVDRRRVALTPTEHAGTEAMRVLGPFVMDLAAVAERMSAAERDVVAGYLQEVLRVYRQHLGLPEDAPVAAEYPPTEPSAS